MAPERKTVVVMVGTRPEVIKMAPVQFALERSKQLRPMLVSTGQHREMLDQSLAVFGLRPELDFGLMTAGAGLSALAAAVLESTSRMLRQVKPAALLVQGDTTTVLGAAIAAFYERIPIGHVEAGLRTYDLGSPWPEEMNRRLVDPIARWCFAPTEWSAQNLRNEKVDAARIHVTGNTVVDALHWTKAKLVQRRVAASTVAERCGIPREFARDYLDDEGRRRPWILVTGHRRESFGAGFENLCQAATILVTRYPELGLLFPVHLNPNVREPVHRLLGSHPRIALTPPVGYEDFIWLMDRCKFVLSDSGGIQEEAPSLGKPVLVTRDNTERPEGVTAGTCTLVGTDPARILQETAGLLEDETEWTRRSALRNPYGDGNAAATICRILEGDLGS